MTHGFDYSFLYRNERLQRISQRPEARGKQGREGAAQRREVLAHTRRNILVLNARDAGGQPRGASSITSAFSTSVSAA